MKKVYRQQWFQIEFLRFPYYYCLTFFHLSFVSENRTLRIQHNNILITWKCLKNRFSIRHCSSPSTYEPRNEHCILKCFEVSSTVIHAHQSQSSDKLLLIIQIVHAVEKMMCYEFMIKAHCVHICII